MSQFLDFDGLKRYDGKIKEYVVSKQIKPADGSIVEMTSTNVFDIPMISAGGNNNLCIYNTDTHNGKYSLSIGSNDDSVLQDSIEMMGGSTIGVTGLTQPVAYGNASYAIGPGCTTRAQGSIAAGLESQAGITGYYYTDITFGVNPAITLSTTRDTTTAPTSIDWAVGDYVSIVNDKKYTWCGKIKSISGNVITLTHELPFSTIVALDAEAQPDDRTIFAVKRVYPTNGKQSSTLEARSGSVELGWGAQAFGARNLAAARFSTTLGWNNIGAGDCGLTYGRDNVAGYASLAGGQDAKAKGNMSIAIGKSVVADGDIAMVIGSAPNKTYDGFTVTIDGIARPVSTAQDIENWWVNAANTDKFSVAKGNYAKALGYGCAAAGNGAVSSGYYSLASNSYSFAHGLNCWASGQYAAVLGHHCEAHGIESFAGGRDSIAQGQFSFAYGNKATAGGNGSVATGYDSTASGATAIAMGYQAKASGSKNIAMGTGATTSAIYGVAIGHSTNASVEGAVAIGNSAVASGLHSISIGTGTRASTAYSIAMGTYNNNKDVAALFAVGDGISETNRHNAFTIYEDGIKIKDTTFTEAELIAMKSNIGASAITIEEISALFT